MNAPDTVAPWLAPLGWLALEASLVVLAALALQPLLRTAAARRSLWRAALLASVTVLAAELTGTGSQLPAQLRLAWQTTFPAPVPPPSAPAPFIPASVELLPISDLPSPIPSEPLPDPLPFTPEPLPPPAPPPSLHHSITPPPPAPWPAFLWLTGLAALLTRAAWTHAGFAWLRLRHFLPAAEALCERVQALAARLGLRRRVRVLASERLRAPAAFGWVRPGVGVPADFTARFAPAQQDAMLAHELAHLATRDPLWQLLADLAVAALWWHPLAWVARHQHRLAAELAADDASQALPDGPVVLAECLLVLGQEAAAAPRAPLGMAGFRSQLGRRVERLVALPRRDWSAPGPLRLALQTTVALLALAAIALLPGCAVNRTAGEAPSRLVAKWWQTKAERGTRNVESRKSFGPEILGLFELRRDLARSTGSAEKLAALESQIATAIRAEATHLKTAFDARPQATDARAGIEQLRRHLERVNQSVEQLVRAINTNALESDQRHLNILQDYQQRVATMLKVEESALVPPVIIQGRVRFNGTPPPERDIPLPPPVLAARTNAPLKTRFHRVSPGGGLADVVVYVKAGLPKQTYPVPEDEFVVCADHYEFQPYIGAVQAGQRIRWESVGTSATSVHPAPTNTANPEFSRALMQYHPFVSKFTAPEHFLRVKVDVFPWMMHYVSVFEHPFFAVTDAEGRFRFPQPLPPGKYTLAAIHRRAGEVVQELNLTEPLPAGAPVPSVEFQFNAPPGSATPPPLVSTPQLPAPPLAADFKPSKPPTREELLERKARVEADIKAAEKTFLPTHPKMVGLRKQLESVEEALKQIQGAEMRMEAVRLRLTQLEIVEKKLQNPSLTPDERLVLAESATSWVPSTIPAPSSSPSIGERLQEAERRLRLLKASLQKQLASSSNQVAVAANPQVQFGLSPSPAAMTNALDISVGRQLFVDDFLIANNTLKRTWHQPVLVSKTPLLARHDQIPPRHPFFESAWYDPTNQLFMLGLVNGTRFFTDYHSPSGTNWVPMHAQSHQGPLIEQPHRRVATDYESLRVSLSREPGTDGIQFGFARAGTEPASQAARSVIPMPVPADGSQWTDMHPLRNGFLVVGRNLYFYFGGKVTNYGPRITVPGFHQEQAAVGLATLRRDGFASLDAGPEGGVLTTKPVTFTGKFMFVNFKTNAPDGEMRIEILDAEGNALERFSRAKSIALAADQTLMGVSWQDGAQDLSALIGRPVRFRFHLKNASLYSFWVGPGQLGRSMGRVAGGGPHFTNDVDTIGNRSYVPLPVKLGALAVGDYLRTEVTYRQGTTNHTLRLGGRVAPAGYLPLPRVKRAVVVAGKTIEEAQASIRAGFLESGFEAVEVKLTRTDPLPPAPKPVPAESPKAEAAPTPVAADVRRLQSNAESGARNAESSQSLVTSAATNAAPLHHQPTVEKLARIRLPEVTYDGLPLSEVLKFLQSDTKKSDPDKADVDFGMQSIYTNTAFVGYETAPPEFAGEVKAQSAGSGTVGVRLNANVPLPRTRIRQVVRTDMDTTLVHVSTVLRDVSVLDALDAIVKTANTPIGYTVETNRVVFRPRVPGHEFVSPRVGINAPGAAVRAQAEKIVFPSVIYDGLPLPEVVKFLIADARKFDPDKRGVNILLTSHYPDPPGALAGPAAPLLDSFGNPIPHAPRPAHPDLGVVLIRFAPEHHNLTLRQTLDVICAHADAGLQNGIGLTYRFEDYGVVFTPKFPVPPVPKPANPPKPGASAPALTAPVAADVRRLQSNAEPGTRNAESSQSLVTSAATPAPPAAEPLRGPARLAHAAALLREAEQARQRLRQIQGAEPNPGEPKPDIYAEEQRLSKLAAASREIEAESRLLEILNVRYRELNLDQEPVPPGRPAELRAILDKEFTKIAGRLRQALDAFNQLASEPPAPKPAAIAPAPSPQTPDAKPQNPPASQSLVTSAATIAPAAKNWTPAQRAILQRLDTVVFPEIAYDGLPLPEVVKFLQADARKFDPEKKGFNFLLNSAAQPLEAPARIDLNTVLIKVTSVFRGLTLGQVLDLVCKTASEPIQFTVEDYGIVFTQRDRAQPFVAPRLVERPAGVWSPAQRALLQRLDTVVFPEITYDGLPLPEVVKFLEADGRKHDPEKRGFNFLLNSTGQPGDGANWVDLDVVLIHVASVLRGLTLNQVLDVICKTADVRRPDGRSAGLQFVVEDYGIIFKPRDLAKPFVAPRLVEQPVGAAVRAKLDKTVIPQIAYDAIPLPEVLKMLTQDARRHGPDKRGVNLLTTRFFPDPPPGWHGFPVGPDGKPLPRLLDAKGNPIPDPQPPRVEPPDLDTVIINVSQVLNGLTLAQVLDVVCQTASRPITYRVEDYGVLITPKYPAPPVPKPANPPKPGASAPALTAPVAADVRRLQSNAEPGTRNEQVSQSLVTSAATDRVAAPDPLQAAQEEAGRRQEQRAALERLLAEAKQFQKIKSWTNAVVRYEEAFTLAKGLGGAAVERQSRDALAGLTQCRLQLAIALQEKFEFQAAAAAADKILPFDPRSAEVEQFRRFNERVEAAHKNRPARLQLPAERTAVMRLVRDGQMYYQMGEYQKARTHLEEAIAKDPVNEAAYYYLRLVSEAQFAVEDKAREEHYGERVVAVTQKWNESTRNALPVPNPYHRTNSQVPFLTHSSKGAQRINRKLEEIVLPEVHFDAVPLVGVVQRLIEDAKKFDPEKKGLNFLINDVAPAAPLLDAAGNPVPVARPVALSEGLVRVTQPLKNLTLRQALDVICKNAELPTQFSVEEYAIAFIPRGPVAYYSRMFRVNPDTFIQGLQGVVGNPVLGVTPGGGNAPGAAGQNQPATTTPAAPVRATVPATVPATQRTAAEANALVRQYFQSAGVTALGATNGSTRVTFNPENGLFLVRGTTNDLRLIEQAIQKVQPGATVTNTVPQVNPAARTNAQPQRPAHSGKGAQRINAKLDEIILPEIHFDSVSLPAVVTWLDGNVKKHDPEKKGLNFLINNVVSDYIAPTGPVAPTVGKDGNQVVTPPRPPVTVKPDLENALVKVRSPIKGLTLRQALDAICMTAVVKLPDGRTTGLKFTVEEYAIVFSPKLPEQADLFSRIFKVDPETFITGLGSVVDEREVRPGSRAALNQALRERAWTNAPAGTNRLSVAGDSVAKGAAGVVNTNVTAELNHLVRHYFTAAGVANLGVTNGPDATQVFFNDRNGLLLVRASLQDLDIIQQAIELLNANKPHVSVAAKLLRVTADDTGKTIGFDWFLGNTQFTRPAAPATNHFVHVDREGNFLLDGRLRSLDQLEAELRAAVRTNPTVSVRISAAPEADYGDAAKVFERTSRMGLTNAYFTRGRTPSPAAPPVAPIAKANVEPRRATFTGILSEPQMQVVWKAVTQRTNMNALNLPAARTETGKPAALTPATGGAEADWARGLKVEFLPTVGADGYVIRGQLTVTRNGKPVLESKFDVWDGQTVMIGNLEPAPATDPAGKKSPHTVLFLTPTLVDPAGNRLHTTSDEMPFSPTGVHPARKP